MMCKVIYISFWELKKWDSFVNFLYKMNWELWGNDIINSQILIMI